jgi:hypothetical protein
VQERLLARSRCIAGEIDASVLNHVSNLLRQQKRRDHGLSLSPAATGAVPVLQAPLRQRPLPAGRAGAGPTAWPRAVLKGELRLVHKVFSFPVEKNGPFSR